MDLARLALTFGALALGGRLGALVDAPLVGEIVVGMLLGPDGAGFVPESDAFILVGDFALCVLVMEGGLSIDVGALRSVGPIALAIAVSGTMLPIALGVAYMSACGYAVITGVAAGTALSSTSIGMATKVLQTLGELTSPLGNLICVAAMVDDVLSLVILAVVSNLDGDGGGSGDVGWKVSRPILESIGVCAVGAALATATPRAMRGGLGKAGDAVASVVFPTVEDRTVWAMLGVTLGVVVASGAAGSTHLLGAFVGGVAFSNVVAPSARDAFARHAELTSWLTSVFFLAVGTRIPLARMFEAKGLVLGVGVLRLGDCRQVRYGRVVLSGVGKGEGGRVGDGGTGRARVRHGAERAGGWSAGRRSLRSRGVGASGRNNRLAGFFAEIASDSSRRGGYGRHSGGGLVIHIGVGGPIHGVSQPCIARASRLFYYITIHRFKLESVVLKVATRLIVPVHFIARFLEATREERRTRRRRTCPCAPPASPVSASAP